MEMDVMKLILNSIVVLVLVSVIVVTAQAKEKTDRALVQPGKVHELCMSLEFGKRLTYAFKSRSAMNFNIHYHHGDEVTFPVEEHLTNEKSEIFTAQSDQDYCLMWTNPNERGQWLNVVYEVR